MDELHPVVLDGWLYMGNGMGLGLFRPTRDQGRNPNQSPESSTASLHRFKRLANHSFACQMARPTHAATQRLKKSP